MPRMVGLLRRLAVGAWGERVREGDGLGGRPDDRIWSLEKRRGLVVEWALRERRKLRDGGSGEESGVDGFDCGGEDAEGVVDGVS